MRLRKKNVSRVAAVAVAAVMAVSAAAPAAFAAAPVANGDTAVVQENGDRRINITYINEEDNSNIGATSVWVGATEEYLSTSLLTDVPNGFTVAPSCPTIAVGPQLGEEPFVTVYCVPAKAKRTVTVEYHDADNWQHILGSEDIEVEDAAAYVGIDVLTNVPAGWAVTADTTQIAVGDKTTSVAVTKVTPAKRTVTVEYHDADNWQHILGSEDIEVEDAADYVGIDVLKKVPAGWNVTADTTQIAVGGKTTSVAVTKATHKVTVKYHDADNWENVVGSEVIEVADNADYVGIDVLKKIPAGWAVTADTTQIAVGNKMATTTVAVTKAARKVTVEYRDADNWNTVVGTEEIEVAGDADYVGIDVLKKIPANWTVTADTTQIAVGGKTTSVAVTKAARKVTVEYRDADNWNTVVGTEVIEVADDADYVGTDVLTKVPAGWAVTADTTQIAVGVETTTVAVTKAARKVTVEYRDADNWNTVVGTEVIEVAGNADYVGTDVLTKVPAGWTVTADTTQIAVGVETTTVAVTKVTTPDPVDPTPTPDPEPTPAPTVNPVTTALGVGAWLLALGGLILGFFGL